jgi:hypothetical protein
VHRKYNNEDDCGEKFSYGVTAVDLEFKELLGWRTGLKRIDPNIHDSLTKSAVSVSTKTRDVIGKVEYTYNLPVVGHIITKKGEENRKKGSVLDKEKFSSFSVYTWSENGWKIVRAFDSWNLRPIPRLPPSAKGAERLSMKLKARNKTYVKNNRTHFGEVTFIDFFEPTKFVKRRLTHCDEEVIIDLLEPSIVNAIGLRSEIPEVVQKRQPLPPFRQLVNPLKVSYVTSYMLYYLLVDESKWVKLGTFKGNNSILEESILDLKQFTRRTVYKISEIHPKQFSY